MLAHIVSLMKNIVIAGSHENTTTSLVSIFQKQNWIQQLLMEELSTQLKIQLNLKK